MLRKAYVDCGFGQLHVTRLSEPDRSRDRPVLLLNSRPRSLLPLLALLPPPFYGIVADIPGMGSSSIPSDGASMADVADAVLACLDDAGIGTADLFGLHTGHKVAAAIAAFRPERVRRLIVAGKTHSLIPDKAARTSAMADHVARRAPDVALVQFEGKYLDDTSQATGFERMFAANYGFDFADALASAKSPGLIVEICTPLEDGAYGRQGHRLAALMASAHSIAVDETDATGLDLYVGVQRMADILSGFLGTADPSTP